MRKKVFSFVKTRIRQRVIAHKKEQSKRFTGKRVITWLLAIAGSSIVLGVLAFMIAFWILGSGLPDVHDLRNFITSESTVIYDRDGEILYTIHGEENRENIDLVDMPQYLLDATISIEDDQFYYHPGFDVGGIIKAGMYEVFGIGTPRGGSTITQQLVKNVFLTPERSYVRKMKELIMAMRLEQALTKDEILELYLNRIPYGSNAFGVQMAAKTFFGKEAKDITLLESSILASLPKAPSKFSPYGSNRDLLMGATDEDGVYVPGRKDLVLDRMEELGYATQEEVDEARESVIDFEFSQYREDIKAPHFVFYVRELLEKKFGDAAVERGGLRVYTTLDGELQTVAEEAVAERKERNVTSYDATNMASLTVDAVNGDILSMVGSVDFFDDEIDGKVNVVTRPRPPGSSFKPFVYAAGFLQGYSPATVLFDVETDFGNDYKPQNYDGEFSGPVSVRHSLASSLNVPAVKMAFLAGVDNVLDLARNMGAESLKGDSDLYGISIGLGTGEVPMIEMVQAYTVFARGGTKIDFNPFLRIEDSNGNVIENFENIRTEAEDVLDPEIAYSVNHVLSDSAARPEGWGALDIPGRPNAAKTGTSNKKVDPDTPQETIKPGDVWTIGYTPRVVTAVWAGNNDNTPMNNNASGVATAGPVWNAIMQKATENHPVEDFLVPDGITEVEVAKYSGKLPSEFTPEEERVSEIFTAVNLPTEVDDIYAQVEVDGVSKKLPTEFTPQSAIVPAAILNFHTQRPDFPNWEEPAQEWIKENFYDGELLVSLPEEYDDVHTATTGNIVPSLRIVSPVDLGIVSFGQVGVVVDIDSQRRIDRVEYILDDQLVDTQTKSPYRGSFAVDEETFKKGKTSLTAKVYDKLLYTDSHTITIDLGGTDTEAPSVSYVFPRAGDVLPQGAVVNLQVSAIDGQGDVSEVIFFFDDNEIGKDTSSPFALTYSFGEAHGNHSLSATAIDYAGNSSKTEIGVRLENSLSFGGSGVSLLQPEDGARFSSNDTVVISGRVSADMVSKITKVEFVSKKKLSGASSARELIGVIEDVKGSNLFSVPWSHMTSGDYEILMKVYLEGGRTDVSNRAIVTIQ